VEVWIDEERPKVFDTTNVVLALAVHLAFFVAVFVFAKFHFKPKETVIPIDLTVVVNENLDGVDDEPPPLDDPPVPEPTPVQHVTPTPPPPPPPAEVKLDAVVKVPEKKKPEEKKPEKPKETLEDRIKRMRDSAKATEKKPEPKSKPEEKKPEPPKKTKEELLKERMEKMRDSAKTVKIKVKDVPSGNGRTERQTRSPDEIAKLLNMGYKPGTKTKIADSTMQYCLSRIEQAINARWDQVNPRIGKSGHVLIAVRFTMSGKMVNCRLSESCGDKVSDAAALTVVRTVGTISGLDKDFLKEFSKQDLVIRYKVQSR
jgi:outer membrane biosynthesis protein TonB